MKTYLEIERASGRVEQRNVTPDGSTGIAFGECPSCKASPFRVQGCGVERVDDRTVRAGGRCVDCGEAVGWIYHEPDTLFGVEEDQAVLHGRPRVY